MNERSGVITFQGNALTLLGDALQVGAKAPDAELLGNDLSAVKLSGYYEGISIVSSVPSLDTPVCDMQTRRFNEEAGKLADDVVILTVSMDLPFAQARWCGAAGVEEVVTLSDHRTADFGLSWGLLIKELRLLTRAVSVVDREGVLRYHQIVGEITEEPDYNAALEAAGQLI